MIVFLSSIPGRSQGGCAHVSVSGAASWTCSCTCFARVTSAVGALLEAVPALGSSHPWRPMEKPWHTCRRDLVAVPSPSYCTTKPSSGCHQSCGVVIELAPC